MARSSPIGHWRRAYATLGGAMVLYTVVDVAELAGGALEGFSDRVFHVVLVDDDDLAAVGAALELAQDECGEFLRSVVAVEEADLHRAVPAVGDEERQEVESPSADWPAA